MPSSVDLGYTKITIQECDAYLMSDDARGEFHPQYHRVNILKGLARKERAWVLIHELTHAVFTQYDLARTLELDPEEAEEHIVHAIGNGWAELIARNPKLWQFLTLEMNK